MTATLSRHDLMRQIEVFQMCGKVHPKYEKLSKLMNEITKNGCLEEDIDKALIAFRKKRTHTWHASKDDAKEAHNRRSREYARRDDVREKRRLYMIEYAKKNPQKFGVKATNYKQKNLKSRMRYNYKSATKKLQKLIEKGKFPQQAGRSR
jgi:hypothetical protein